MKASHKPARALPIEGIQANGYLKGTDRKLNKFYRSMFNLCGTPRRKFPTATGALGYGIRVAERYQRIFGQPQPDRVEEVAC